MFDRFKRSGKRGEIFLATKFGLQSGIQDRTVCGEPDYVPKAFEASLSKLGTDYADLYYLHRPDPQVPIEVSRINEPSSPELLISCPLVDCQGDG